MLPSQEQKQIIKNNSRKEELKGREEEEREWKWYARGASMQVLLLKCESDGSVLARERKK